MSQIRHQLVKAAQDRMCAQLEIHKDQRELARLLGLTQTDVSLCKRGKLDTMSTDRLLAILARLGAVVAVTVTDDPDSDGSKAMAAAVAENEARKAKIAGKASAFLAELDEDTPYL